MSSTPTPPGATERSLDREALARLRELDPDGRHGVVQRVLQAFDTSLTRMLVQLRGELGGGHADVVATVAHTLKSSSASVGALSLSQACAEIETRLRSGTPTSPAGLDRDITRLIEEGEAALEAAAAILRPRA
jgi:HPt (histidine-containing phosphotransfer) domain-containing protein